MTQRCRAWPHFISTAPEIAYGYVDDYHRLRPDITVGKRDLTALAMVRDPPIQPLRKTAAAFNRYASGQAGHPFGRTGDHNQLEEG